MSDKPSNKEYGELLESANARQEVVRRLWQAQSLVLVTHDRPDGDGLGSMAALARSARLAGKSARIACSEKVPHKYVFLLKGEELLDAEQLVEASGQADCVVVLDTCAWNQLESVAGVLRTVNDKLVVIDHHHTRDDLGTAGWHDESAAAAGVLVTELLDRLGWPTDRQVAEAAVAAICCDTGWLRFSNTDARTLHSMAHWLNAGVDVAELYRRLYEADRPQRIALMARMLSTMQLHADGRLALLTITQGDFEQTGARPDETENLINEALRIEQVEMAILLVETAEGIIRGSLRSKRQVDVAALAKSLGGGGHQRAAGFRQVGSMKAVTAAALAAALSAV